MTYKPVLILGKMKKILFILFLFSSLTVWGQNQYYVSTNGTDVTYGGTFNEPWATLSYAISRVTTFGSVIHVEGGTYPAISTQMLLRDGVSIEGDGRNITTIPLTYSASYPCIKLETAEGWTNKNRGHQQITGIKFVGSTTPGTPIGICAIGVNFRHYVEIHDCWFEDFRDIAVWFNGEPTYSLDDDVATRIKNPYESRTGIEGEYFPYEDSFCEGNKFYNNQVHNCCRELDPVTHSASGELEFSMQDGFLVYGNTMTALGRAGYRNGVPIKMIIGFNKNTKIHNNIINAGHKSQNYWQFGIEIWWDLGGLEIYENVVNGSIDLCASFDHYGLGYGAKIYDNDIGYPTTSNEHDTGINLEHSHMGTYIYRNKIHHVGTAIGINNTVYSSVQVNDGVYIKDNLMVELAGTEWQTWGIAFSYQTITNPGVLWKNMYIQHNTIVAKSDAPYPTYYGIVLPTVERWDGFYIENNILINWERGAIWAEHTRTQATNFFIRNNLIFESYNNNDPVYVNGYPSSGITYSETVKADPLFISASDYRPQATSPCIAKGLYLGYTWLNTDYAGNNWMNKPSIGAYEIAENGLPILSTSPVTNITGTTAVSGGNITSDGGLAITARGVCWSISSAPTVAGDKTTNGTGTGTFTSNVTGLTNGETYYLRAYATNSIGTAYGSEYVFTTPIPISSGVRPLEHNGKLILFNGKLLKLE